VDEHGRGLSAFEAGPGRFEGFLVTVDRQEPAIRPQPLEQQPAVTACAQGAVDEGSTWSWLEELYGLF
jgi:hypothetical protein